MAQQNPKVMVVYSVGQGGVNVDSSSLHMQDDQLRRSQNGIRDPLGVEGGLKNRPGLTRFNTTAGAGAILGGIGVPLLDSLGGVHFFYIGRGAS